MNARGPDTVVSSILRVVESAHANVLTRNIYISRLGKSVGKYPWHTILLSLILGAVCLAGLANFQKEGRVEKMWVPEESQALKDKVWIEARFPEKFHSSVFIFQHSNVLTVESLHKVVE